jgi:hypothetical protein
VRIPTLHAVLGVAGMFATITLAAGDAATQVAPSRTQVLLLGMRRAYHASSRQLGELAT